LYSTINGESYHIFKIGGRQGIFIGQVPEFL
jgi:hypothetical protein